MEKEFKNFREKQAYYKQRTKQTTQVWVSISPDYIRDRSKRVIKGRTYIKPKEMK